jgi:hypothetical protein
MKLSINFFAFGGTRLVEGRGCAFDGLYLNLTIYRHAQAAGGALNADVLRALNADEKQGWAFLATKTSVTRME